MTRYFIKLAFAGTRYHGWQMQNNALTVQQELTDALRILLNCDPLITGCGRTDTGVHAKNFYAHFDFHGILGKEDCLKIVYRLNSILPDDIVIKELLHVLPDAHARFSASSRTYKYVINRVKDPFRIGFAYHVYGDLDVDLMNKGAELLIKCEDFSSFAKSHTQVKTNNCNLMYAGWQGDDEQLIFTITANRFLRNMVRAIVGTLLDMGRRRIDIAALQAIVDKRSRSLAGYSVPACGLFLTEVEYPGEIFI
jgi:tRNA pseudouridine38-40 synthase